MIVSGYASRRLQCRTDGGSGVMRSGVDVEHVKRPLALQPAVGNAVQRHPAAVCQAGLAGSLLQSPREREQGVLGVSVPRPQHRRSGSR